MAIAAGVDPAAACEGAAGLAPPLGTACAALPPAGVSRAAAPLDGERYVLAVFGYDTGARPLRPRAP